MRAGAVVQFESGEFYRVPIMRGAVVFPVPQPIEIWNVAAGIKIYKRREPGEARPNGEPVYPTWETFFNLEKELGL